MGKYRVLEPVTYVEGNKAIMHLREAVNVTIDDSVAAKLGDKVRRVDTDDKDSAKDTAKADSSGKSGGK